MLIIQKIKSIFGLSEQMGNFENKPVLDLNSKNSAHKQENFFSASLIIVFSQNFLQSAFPLEANLLSFMIASDASLYIEWLQS